MPVSVVITTSVKPVTMGVWEVKISVDVGITEVTVLDTPSPPPPPPPPPPPSTVDVIIGAKVVSDVKLLPVVPEVITSVTIDDVWNSVEVGITEITVLDPPSPPPPPPSTVDVIIGAKVVSETTLLPVVTEVITSVTTGDVWNSVEVGITEITVLDPPSPPPPPPPPPPPSIVDNVTGVVSDEMTASVVNDVLSPVEMEECSLVIIGTSVVPILVTSLPPPPPPPPPPSPVVGLIAVVVSEIKVLPVVTTGTSVDTEGIKVVGTSGVDELSIVGSAVGTLSVTIGVTTTVGVVGISGVTVLVTSPPPPPPPPPLPPVSVVGLITVVVSEVRILSVVTAVTSVDMVGIKVGISGGTDELSIVGSVVGTLSVTMGVTTTA